MRFPTIGVLSFQGDFERHKRLVEQLGAACRYVRTAEEIGEIDGLILPGGESTTIGKLMARFGLLDAVTERVELGMPIFGTCAGAILLATEIETSTQERLGIIPMTVRRNAYGRQIESFEANLNIGALSCGRGSVASDEPIRGVFIRAPIIVDVDSSCEVLVSYEEQPVVVRYGHAIASTFHPELTGEERIHRCFLELVDHSLRAATGAS